MTTKVTRDVFDGSIRPIETIDINGGTIDGAIIGSGTPAAGYFTSIQSSSLKVTGTIDFTGATVTGGGTSAVESAINVSGETGFVTRTGNPNSFARRSITGSVADTEIGITIGNPAGIIGDPVIKLSLGVIPITNAIDSSDAFLMLVNTGLKNRLVSANDLKTYVLSGGSAFATASEILSGSVTNKPIDPSGLAALWKAGVTPLVAASTLNLPSSGGSMFTVTGSTPIDKISVEGNGRKIWLNFANSCTLNHANPLSGSANLILPSGQNISIRAGDMVELMYTGSGWQVLNHVVYGGNESAKLVRLTRTGMTTWTNSAAVYALGASALTTSGGVQTGSVNHFVSDPGNYLRIRGKIYAMLAAGTGEDAPLVAALFADTSSNAIATACTDGTDAELAPVPIQVEWYGLASALSISSAGFHTFTFRMGTSGGGTMYFNGNASAGFFSGTLDSHLTVEEIRY